MSHIYIVNKHSIFSLFTFVFLYFTQEMLGLGSSSRTQQQPQRGRGPMAPQQQEVHNRYQFYIDIKTFVKYFMKFPKRQ